jgi:hypothetical protein
MPFLFRAAALLPLALPAACSADRGAVAKTDEASEVANAVAVAAFPQPVASISGVQVSRSGRVYMIDNVRQRLWVFDSTGRYIETIGREGKGPGEFGMIGTFGFRADTLWVQDDRLFRVTLFDSLHRVAKVIPLTGFSGVMSLVALLPAGKAIAVDLVMAMLANDEEVQIGMRWLGMDWSAIVSGKDRVTIDTIMMTEFRHSMIKVERPDTSPIYGVQPWPDRDLYATSSSGELLAFLVPAPVATRGEPAFRLRLLTGSRLIFEKDIAYEAIEITDAMVDSAMDRTVSQFTTTLDAWPNRNEARDAIRKAIHRPAHLPPALELHVGNDTTIWVRRAQRQPSSAAVWEVFDGSGRRLASVKAPADLRVLTVSRHSLWGIDWDAQGEQRLTRYSVSSRPR